MNRDQITPEVLASVLEQTAYPVIVTDPAGSIGYVNQAFEHATGYMRKQVIGKPAGTLYGNEDAEVFRRLVLGTLADGHLWQGRLEHRRTDGSSFPADVTFSPVRDSSGSTVQLVAIVRDTTHEEDHEAHVRQMHKMEALGTLAGGIAHDCNNILYAIQGYADLVKTTVGDNPDALHNLEELKRASARAKDLIARILTFSRGSEHPLEPLSLQALLTVTLDELRSSIPSGIELHMSIDEDCPQVDGDASQLKEVILQLCTNAIRAMRKEGGRLEVKLTYVSPQAAEVLLADDLEPRPYARLAVGDTGVGMDGTTRTRIFDPYFTTDPTHEGAGMGLAIVHGIVTSHDGTITATSTPGEGSEIEILLPTHLQHAPQESEPPQ
ncbi:nitrogen regulation protein NR(II) [Candidatus Eisenbacteria bacterium]|uniref:histidine kinase n=1 Tax=Eiseniibacteriota bacterium TaxID=2212470 RepID=A0ABV6YI42_UNCEI